MSTKPRLSRAMFQALYDGVVHGNLAHSIEGMSAHGAFTGTREALFRNGWIDRDSRVTDSGREAMIDAYDRKWGYMAIGDPRDPLQKFRTKVRG